MQDKTKAEEYNKFTKDLEIRLKIEGNLDFFEKGFKPALDTFPHSGLAIRDGATIGLRDTNSIKKGEFAKNFIGIKKLKRTLGSDAALILRSQKKNRIEDSISRLHISKERSISEKPKLRLHRTVNSLSDAQCIKSDPMEIYNTDFKMTKKNLMEYKCGLHPLIPKDCKMPPSSWVPGFRKYFQASLRTLGVEEPLKAKKFMLSGYNKKSKFIYNEKDVMEARSKPIIRCASEYLTEEEKYRREHKERDKKILKTKFIDPKSGVYVQKPIVFKNVFGARSQEEEFNKGKFLNIGVQYNPTSDHEYRSVEPNKWIAGNFLKV